MKDKRMWVLFGLMTGLVAMTLTACTGGGGLDAGGSSSGGSSIFGLVTDGSTFGKPVAGKVGAMSSSISNCKVKAYTLDSTDPVAETTTNSSGQYSFTDLDQGENYKIIADCGANGRFASVAQADEDAYASSPVQTNAGSTAVAIMVVKAIVTAINDAIEAIPGASDTVKAAIRNAIKESMDTIVEQVKSAVESAIETGSMTAPTVAQAEDLAYGLETLDPDAASTSDVTTVLDGAEGDFADGIPAAVDQATNGAAQTAAAMPGCDSSISGTSALSCIRAVSKLLYNGLNMPIALNKSVGAFASVISGDCSNLNSGSTPHFPNATIVDGDDDGGDEFPSGICAFMPKLGTIDRNESENHHGGGEPVFTESFDFDTSGGIDADEIGVLTAIGQSFFTGKKYTLSDLDNIVFSYDVASGAGMNVRVFHKRVNYTTGAEDIYYFKDDGTWAKMPTFDDNGITRTHRADDFAFSIGARTWELGSLDLGNTPDAIEPIIANIGPAPVGVFAKKFAGPIPSQAELDEWIDEGRKHDDWNPSGQKEFPVLTTEPPAWDANNYCWDNDPSTACTTQGGDPITTAAIRVDIAMADKITDATSPHKDMRPATSLTKASDGDYYIHPMWSPSGFNGAFTFINVSDGRRLRDDFFNERGVKVILQTSECDGTDFPASGPSCATGDVFSVELNWDNCDGGSGDCPEYTAHKTAAATFAPKMTLGGSLSFSIQTDYKTEFYEYGDAARRWSHDLMTMGDWENMEKILYTDATIADLSDATVSTGLASGANEYNLGVWRSCTAGTCTAEVYLIDKDGVPQTGGTPLTGDPALCGDVDCNVTGITKFASFSANDHDGTEGGTQTLTDVAVNRHVDHAPVPNVNFACSKEPFFVDGNANGELDCLADDSGADPATNDVSLSHQGDYQWWSENIRWTYDCDSSPVGEPAATKCALRNLPMIPRRNMYVFSDPVGIKKLMTTAFPGYFDGNHSITSSTQLNAIQGFALIWMFFEEEDAEIPGIVSEDGKFRYSSPMFADGPPDIQMLNLSIGGGIQKWAH